MQSTETNRWQIGLLDIFLVTLGVSLSFGLLQLQGTGIQYFFPVLFAGSFGYLTGRFFFGSGSGGLLCFCLAGQAGSIIPNALIAIPVGCISAILSVTLLRASLGNLRFAPLAFLIGGVIGLVSGTLLGRIVQLQPIERT